MPAVRYYLVTETREVRVSATSPSEAVMTGAAILREGEKSSNQVRSTDISAREDF